MRANIGCTTKSSAALVSMVAVYRPSTPRSPVVCFDIFENNVGEIWCSTRYGV